MRSPVHVRKRSRHLALAAAHSDWPSIHLAWIETINSAGGIGTDRARIGDYAADVVETLYVRPEGIGAALNRFGQRLASEGWPLEQVSSWIDWLAEICPNRSANALHTFASGVALAQGWTAGNQRGLEAAGCFDAVTGLCTAAFLRLRLEQVFERSSASELEPNWLYRLIIIDADLGEIPSFEGDAVMVVLASLVEQRFTAGETIACDGSRIFVLVDSSDQLDERVAAIVEESRSRSLLVAARVFGWVEALPDTADQIDRYMADLLV